MTSHELDTMCIDIEVRLAVTSVLDLYPMWLSLGQISVRTTGFEEGITAQGRVEVVVDGSVGGSRCLEYLLLSLTKACFKVQGNGILLS